MSLFDTISVVLCEAEEEESRRLDPNIFLSIPPSAADVAALSPKGINTLLANGVIAFFIKDQVICLEILLTVSFSTIEFLKI